MFYTHYNDNEIELNFQNYDIIYKDKRIIKKKVNDEILWLHINEKVNK